MTNDTTESKPVESADRPDTEAQRYLDNWRRAEADLQNYKRRVEQEKGELARFGAKSLVKDLLTVLDDFDRALAASGDANAGWVKGVQLTRKNLQAVLERHGVTEIPAAGLPFDPNVHEAIMEGPGNEGVVIDVIQRGFRLHDQVLRPAQVRVGNGQAADAPTASN